MHALVFEGRVVDLSNTPFEVAPPMEWVACDASVTVCMLMDEHGNFTQAPEPAVHLTPEQILAEAKAERAAEVAAIVVTTVAGNSFDGHEDAQNRMARAISIMTEADALPWVLSNNSVINVNRAELSEALRLAGLKMAELWVKPYLQ